MEPPLQRAWQLVDTIGPLFSHSGLKNWDLCLAREAVIACPRSLWLTLKAGLWAGLGFPGAMQRGWANSASPTGERVLQDDGDGRWRRYTLQDLASITVTRCAGGANEIRITRHDMKPHLYGLGDRNQTDRCRTVLGALYPALYREENF
ncbi:MAG: hypothetical protein OEV36_08840 [Myxococcales bacterium]|nr:hypothetical protein [Myxococcales bacterium]